jgi:probable rRNA maturation factor
VSKINFFVEGVDYPGIDKKSIQKQIIFLIQNEGKIPGEISVIFCTDDYLLEINKQYLQHDYYTDILTFDYSEGYVVSGDLFISIDRIKDNAAQFNRLFREELYRVVFHGILHLTGYSDHSREEKREIRMKEDYYLSVFTFERDKE